MPSYARGSDNFDSGQVIGQNQTWQDVTASRVAGVTYTNTTGKPIEINVTAGSSSTVSSVTSIVDGMSISVYGQGVASRAMNVSCIIPNNSTYSITLTSATIVPAGWYELR